MTVLALLGWLVAGLLGAALVLARRRLERVACAEHELRGPITALTLGVEALARDPRGYARAEPLAAELVRIRAGLGQLADARGAEERADALRIVRGLARSWDGVARRDGRVVRLRWRAGSSGPVVDGGRLAQALGNALSNAVEHGDGPVEVLATRRSDALHVEVRDAGGGFTDRPRPRRGRGLGIAARAAGEAGGSLSLIQSDGGAAVSIELPVSER